jgi:glycosyltransferase involved in cell wall biosynthesis
MQSVLSYFKSYFDPEETAPLIHHSAGQIALQCYGCLKQFGEVQYFDSNERPKGLRADLFIGHFWSFLDVCRTNSFKTKIAFYSVSDPERTRQLLNSLAGQFGVPFPSWDLPPASFDHQATMETADLVFVVGNTYTIETFPPRWRDKLRLLNYSVDDEFYDMDTGAERRGEFCYLATHCGLRKGFMDVLRTWSEIETTASRLHVVGHINHPWDELLRQRNRGNVIHHGWIDSHTSKYLRLIRSCKFAHVPTYSEGQMGTLLELIYAGCVPITTRASGVDERVLKHCLLVEPLNIKQQTEAIREALSWSETEYLERRDKLLQAARKYQTWEAFNNGIISAIREIEVVQ